MGLNVFLTEHGGMGRYTDETDVSENSRSVDGHSIINTLVRQTGCVGVGWIAFFIDCHSMCRGWLEMCVMGISSSSCTA